MKMMVDISRVIVGILFIVSGLIKVNDPSGLAYKMDEYFAVWGWNWASQLSLFLSLTLNALEIAAGVALITGWKPKFTTRLLLLLIVFFTFLTGYAVISGKIKTCGCFGDCIPLTAMQSFLKDIFLLVLILLLVWKYHLIKPWFPVKIHLALMLGTVAMVLLAEFHVLYNLPFVDCLPYKTGNNLQQQMQAPPGSVPDSTTIIFTYKKDGKNVSFDASGFPDDFDEDNYEFVKREEKLIRKGNATPPIADLTFTTTSGTDTTEALMASESKYILFAAKDFDGRPGSWTEKFQKIYEAALAKNMNVYIMTNQPAAVRQWLGTKSGTAAEVLTIDGTVLKTFIRTKVGAVAMEGALVKGKWSEMNLDDTVKWINAH